MRIAVMNDEIMILKIIKDKITRVYNNIDVHLFSNGNDYLNDKKSYI